MLNLIFLSPVVAVIAGILIIRYGVLKKPFTKIGISLAACFLLGAFVFPLKYGVWIPDLLGQTRVLARAKSANGTQLELRQAWNFVDFYSTELRVSQADGTSKMVLVDGDAHKHWNASLEINDALHQVKAVYANGAQSRNITW